MWKRGFFVTAASATTFALVWSCSSSSSPTGAGTDGGEGVDATASDGGFVRPLDSGPVGMVDAGVTDSGSDAGLRTVTGAYVDTFEQDDLTKSMKPRAAPAGETLAVLVPAGTGYTTIPVMLAAASGTFSASNVPLGHYFLVLTNAGLPFFQDCVADTLSLGAFRPGRADLTFVTQSTPITFNITGLDPWVKGSVLDIVSSQGGVNLRPFNVGGVTQPAANATSASPIVDWQTSEFGQWPAGLPVAAKNDVVYVSTGTRTTVGAAPASGILRYITQYAKLTDLTVTDGVANAESVPLVAAAQTGSAAINVHYTQFAALTTAVNPNATPSALSIAIFAQPYGNGFPYLPGIGSARLLDLGVDVSSGTAFADAGAPDGGVPFADYDYGALAYGQFLDARYKEYTSLNFSFKVSFTAAGATPSAQVARLASSRASVTATAFAPLISPPKAPRVNGLDAFAAQAGVTTTPNVTWTAPVVGAATSYSIEIIKVENVGGATVLTPVADAYVYAPTTSFRVPAGVLVNGATYFAVVTANAAPWDLIDLSAGFGTPLDTADVVTNTFAP